MSLRAANWSALGNRISVAAVLSASLALSACGGGSSDVSNGTGAQAQTYSISGTVHGLNSSGLVLSVNGTALSVPASTTTQSLAASLPSGTQYSVSVQTQPTGETCSVAGGTGTITSANVANVVVTCSDQAYPLGGKVSGLNGAGLVLANGSNAVSVSAGATSFTMPTPVAYTSSYQVTVQTEPSGEACSVTNGSGTMPASAVSNVSVTCTDQPFTLGGTITGLGSNTGLVLINGNDTLEVAAGSTTFTMAAPVSFGSPYAVSVQSSPAGLTCTASNASGSMPATNIASVVITCSDQSYTLGGSFTGLHSSGLVLANGTDTLTISSSDPATLAVGTGSFNMPTPVAYGSPYDVTVQTQPPGLTCTPSNNAGTMPAGNVTTVVITCSANTYTVGGSISGLTASGLVLLDNNGDPTTIDANATQFTMNTGVAYGAGYDVTVQSEPTGLVCTVSNGSGTVGAGDVSSISIACVSNTTILYSFAGPTSDGENPYASLIQGSDGNLYGTTVNGGAYGYGTVFEFSPSSGTETVLYSFAGGNTDGANPYGLIEGTDGNFYGITNLGGASDAGTIFEFSPSTGTETVVHSFGTGGDGVEPQSTLIQASDGNLYGTAPYGGAYGDGAVFEYSPSTGAEMVLYSFAGGSTDGKLPVASLIQGSDGNLYGTTLEGGANSEGTVFGVSPTSGGEAVLYSFGSFSGDGYWVTGGLIQGSDGNLYGTAAFGGANGAGTVFKVSPSTGAETVLYSFAGGSADGANPASLIQGSDGNLYGTTLNAGADSGTNGGGTVFEYSPSTGTETTLHFFGGVGDGAAPYAGLIQGSNGNLYGATYRGGTNSDGTVFEVALQ
jgi:uncharacterized repeat protein (TIGR03803 family)